MDCALAGVDRGARRWWPQLAVAHRPRCPGRGAPARCPRPPRPARPQLPRPARPSRSGRSCGCGGTMYAVGSFTADHPGRHHLHAGQRIQLQRHRPVHGHLVGPERQWHGQLDRADQRLHRTPTSAASSPRWTGRAPITSPTSGPTTTRWSTTSGHNANGQVETLLAPKGHLLVGGFFKGINGSSADPYYASLNPGTGRDDGYLEPAHLRPLRVPGCQDQQHRGLQPATQPRRGQVLVEGVFTSVAAAPPADLHAQPGGTHGNVSEWNSAQFSQFCADKQPFYIQAAAWSPDSTRSTSRTPASPRTAGTAPSRSPGCARGRGIPGHPVAGPDPRLGQLHRL